MNTQLVKKSANAKTGPIPVTTSSRSTCPKACPFNHGNGCYADAGYYTRLNWDKVTKGARGLDWNDFLAGIEALPAEQLWRHNVAGDLRGDNDKIDALALSELTAANAGKNGFTYTHYPMTRGNANAVKKANLAGFTVNASANNPKQAADYFKSGLPTVTVLPADHAAKKTVVNGVTIVTCPATYRDDVTCSSCGLCQVSDRRVVVGFPAHGGQAKKATIIARSAA